MMIRALLVAAVLLTPGVDTAIAQSNDDSRVARLEETVRLLEQRVATLEAQLHAAPTPAPVAPAKANWRKLRNGMSEADVERLLGSPSKVNANQVTFVWWYDATGFVRFDATSRNVVAWNEP